MERSIIFDMDGTLFQTDKVLEIALEETFNHLRKENKWSSPTPLQRYREIMGVPLPVVWETLLPDHEKVERELANQIFHTHLLNFIKLGRGALYPDVEEVFRFLKDHGFHIFIASNGLEEYLHTITDYYGLGTFITETFSIQYVESGNKSELVKGIIEKYDIQIGAVVGDRLSDIKAAKENGLLAIGCRFDFSQSEELKQADIVIDALSDIPSFINNELVAIPSYN